MYRKRNGSLGFSFTKFANAAVPNFFADPYPSMQAGLEPLRKDMLYNHQIASTNFHNLDDRSFFVAGITDNERTSKNVFKALQKHDILDKDGKADTYKIGPNFINQLAIINMRRQKELINMLFWWEEECHRFTKLKAEDDELSTMIEEAGRHATEDSDEDDRTQKEMVDQLKFARERVRMKIRQRPTQRRQDTEANTDNIMDSFRGRAMSAPMVVGTSAQASAPGRDADEMLPDYHVVTTK